MTAVDPGAGDLAGLVVYDARPRILPVSIRLDRLRGLSVILHPPSASLATPPVSPVSRVSDQEPAAVSGIAHVGPEDPGTDLEDELDYDDLDFDLVSPLPWMVSPLPELDSLRPVSPSQYPAPPLPASVDSVSVTPLPPGPIRVVNALPTIDSFPTYSMSPALSYYVPETSSISEDLPGPSDCISPGSPAAMNRFLAADALLLNTSSDLQMLPLPLLRLPDGGTLPMETVVAPARDYLILPSEHSVSASPDMSLEGPFGWDVNIA